MIEVAVLSQNSMTSREHSASFVSSILTQSLIPFPSQQNNLGIDGLSLNGRGEGLERYIDRYPQKRHEDVFAIGMLAEKVGGELLGEVASMFPEKVLVRPVPPSDDLSYDKGLFTRQKAGDVAVVSESRFNGNPIIIVDLTLAREDGEIVSKKRERVPVNVTHEAPVLTISLEMPHFRKYLNLIRGYIKEGNFTEMWKNDPQLASLWKRTILKRLGAELERCCEDFDERYLLGDLTPNQPLRTVLKERCDVMKYYLASIMDQANVSTQ